MSRSGYTHGFVHLQNQSYIGKESIQYNSCQFLNQKQFTGLGAYSLSLSVGVKYKKPLDPNEGNLNQHTR